MVDRPLAIFGTGEMARYYVDALRWLRYPLGDLLIVARSPERGRALSESCGAQFCPLDDVERRGGVAAAIVAVTQDALPEVAQRAARAGARKILIEKPGALSSVALRALNAQLTASGVLARIAFNRRFFPSVEFCRKALHADGGAVSCFFEVTEIETRVLGERESKNLPAAVMKKWGLANAIHVIDLAFHLAGLPCALQTNRKGSLAWHPSGAVFAGSGVTERGTLMAYLGNWGAAGRWRLEVTSAVRRMVLCPLETVTQQMTNTFDVSPVQLAAEPEGLKPGLTAMIREFLDEAGDRARLPRLDETAKTLEFAEKIFHYS